MIIEKKVTGITYPMRHDVDIAFKQAAALIALTNGKYKTSSREINNV